jgi:hypothetical protein
MANANTQTLHDEWQSAVRAHAALISAGRISGLTARELDDLERPYVVRIDAAFLRLKRAEEEQLPVIPPLFK